MKLISFGMISFLAGTALSQNGRIVGGFEVSPEFKYPWMVSIFRYEIYYCGGILLPNNHVVTAAHCTGFGKASLGTYEIQLHRHNLSKSIEEENGKAFKVDQLFLADGYDPETNYNDIAVFKFNSTERFESKVQIDTVVEHKDGMRVTALGWGGLKELGENVPELREVVVPVYDKKCAKIYQANSNYTIIPTQLCAGFIRGGKDSCQGDSGGPLFTYVNDKPLLVGVTSNGLSCAKPNTPGIYTRVARFSTWLNDVVKGKVCPTPVRDW